MGNLRRGRRHSPSHCGGGRRPHRDGGHRSPRLRMQRRATGKSGRAPWPLQRAQRHLRSSVDRPFHNGIDHILIVTAVTVCPAGFTIRINTKANRSSELWTNRHGLLPYSSGLAHRLLKDTLGLLDTGGRQFPLAGRHLLTKLHQLLAKPFLGNRKHLPLFLGRMVNNGIP